MVLDEPLRRTALVTGASSGLGRHFAWVLAKAGFRIVLAGRRAGPLEALSSEIESRGWEAKVVVLNVTDETSIEGAFSEIDQRELVPDVLINNAGIATTKSALEISAADWDSILDTNLRGAFLMARAAARRMKTSDKGGSIINIASIAGIRPAGNLSAYSASKAGLLHLTRTLALEWARYGIRVNALCPGYIATDINRDFFAGEAGQALIKRIPQRRLGKTEDLDGALLLFASDAGRYITGASLAIDGGHLVSSL